MTSRCNLPVPDEVRVIVETALTDSDLEQIIDDAALVAGPCVKKLSGDRQRAIVKYIAAHLIAQSGGGGEAMVTSRKLGDASVTFSRAQVGQNLMGTSYGQRAAMLDPTGCLARLGERSAYMKVL